MAKPISKEQSYRKNNAEIAVKGLQALQPHSFQWAETLENSVPLNVAVKNVTGNLPTPLGHRKFPEKS